MRAVILGTGYYVPKERLTNAFFEGKTVRSEDKYGCRGKVIVTSAAWILERSGIEERRKAAHDEEGYHMAARAVQRALRNAGKTPEDLEGIIVATVTDKQMYPNCAQKIRNDLAAFNARLCYDMNAACAGFPLALENAALHITNHHFPTMCSSDIYAVVGVEKLTGMVDYNDLRPNDMLFSDGAGAVILDPSEEPDRGVVATYTSTQTEEGNLDLIFRTKQGLLNMTDGPKVFKVGVRGLVAAYYALMEKIGWQKEDIILIPHQANLRMMEQAKTTLGLEKEQIVNTICKYGNTSAASIPISLAVASRRGMVQPYTNLIMVGFGAGMVISGAAVVM